MYLCCPPTPPGLPTPPAPPTPIFELGLEGSVPGDRLKGEVECVRGECRDVRADVVAPGFVDVVIVRGVEEGDVTLVCVVEEDV